MTKDCLAYLVIFYSWRRLLSRKKVLARISEMKGMLTPEMRIDTSSNPNSPRSFLIFELILC